MMNYLPQGKRALLSFIPEQMLAFHVIHGVKFFVFYLLCVLCCWFPSPIMQQSIFLCRLYGCNYLGRYSYILISISMTSEQYTAEQALFAVAGGLRLSLKLFVLIPIHLYSIQKMAERLCSVTFSFCVNCWGCFQNFCPLLTSECYPYLMSLVVQQLI